jgi:putative ATPase
MSHLLRESIYPNGQVFQIVQGDLTQEPVDAIVNAANADLKHGGGVAGIISRKGGQSIQNESNDWVEQNGPVSHSKPAYTTAGVLPYRYIIHAVGPVWGSGDEDEKLTAAISGSLKIAGKLKLRSLAFPAISTGIFGFPKDRAAKIFFRVIQDYFTQGSATSLRMVRLTLFDKKTVKPFLEVWDEQFG